MLTKNLNPLSTEHKIQAEASRKMLYMLWNECFPNDIYKHICKKDNFIYLNRKNVLHQKNKQNFFGNLLKRILKIIKMFKRPISKTQQNFSICLQ